MREYTNKPQNQSRALDSNPRASKQAPIDMVLQQYKERNIQRFADDEEDEILQGKFDTAQCTAIDGDELLQGKFDTSPDAEQAPIQQEIKPNNTGLPDNLKTGIENLSGYSMDDVRVHYNSDKPAQLNALAYAQGTDIHVAPGQEQHLAHEGWHVVQQKQGRVQPVVQLQGAKINNCIELEHEAEVMGGSASSKQYLTQAQLKNTLHESVIQRKEVNVRITGITHLVQKQEGQEDSIMEGTEYQEVSKPTTLCIDDEEIINSNRGPNQELFEHIDRLQKDKIYQWFQVKSIAENKLSNNQIYVRGGTFQSFDTEEHNFIRHEKARKRGQNQVQIFITDDWYEGRISEYKKEPEKWMRLSLGDKTVEVRVSQLYGDVKVGDIIRYWGKEGTVTKVFNKEVVLYKIHDVMYQGIPQPDEDGQWVKSKDISPLSFIPQRSSVKIINYHPPTMEPYGAEYVKPGGEIDITSHAIGSGVYGFHPDSEEPSIPYVIDKSYVTIDNPLIIQNKGHGECFKTFSKELAQLTKGIYLQTLEPMNTMKKVPEFLESNEFKKKREILFVKLKWLLSRAGHRPPEISVIDQAIISFLKLYTEQSDYVEQVSTILFSNLGFGGIYGNPETGLSSMSTGNIKFIAHDDEGYKRRIRDGERHVFVDGSQF